LEIKPIIPTALQIRGVYQTLFGCAMQIIKQAIEVRNIMNIHSIISVVLKLALWGSSRKITIKIITTKVINDNTQAGILAKRDFFTFFLIIAGF